MAFNFFMHSSLVMIWFTGHTFGQISVHLTHIRETQQPSPHTTRPTPLPCCNTQQRALPQAMMHMPPTFCLSTFKVPMQHVRAGQNVALPADPLSAYTWWVLDCFLPLHECPKSSSSLQCLTGMYSCVFWPEPHHQTCTTPMILHPV